MMHNDEDGAVPWYQGIEMFVAMRRLPAPEAGELDAGARTTTVDQGDHVLGGSVAEG